MLNCDLPEKQIRGSSLNHGANPPTTTPLTQFDAPSFRRLKDIREWMKIEVVSNDIFWDIIFEGVFSLGAEESPYLCMYGLGFRESTVRMKKREYPLAGTLKFLLS